MKKLWLLGNTTVRSPFRLRDALIALSMSPLQGNLRGCEQEIAFRNLLGSQGIVKLGNDETYSVGRKWRAALSQLGFLYPKISKKIGILQIEIGSIDMITPSGWRLIRAETVPSMQECFLRALAAYYIPSPLEPNYGFSVFSPLRHILLIMLELEKSTGESTLNFEEMAFVVQSTSNDESLAEIVFKILEIRKSRENSPNQRKFNQLQIAEAQTNTKYVSTTFSDYADTNLRYLKSTGLVQSKGRGVSLVPEKRVFIEKLIQNIVAPDTVRAYLLNLCNGADLPTDNKELALIVLEDLLKQINKRGIAYGIEHKPLDTPADISIICHEIEQLISEQNEEQYAALQFERWEEIKEYMNLLISGKTSKFLSNGEEIEVPKCEAPAYFEWILWRAFLAINRLVNKPYQSRRFKIDQDFLPVGTAPGNGPDLIFEFHEFVLVVEVTLTDNSRQEAAEGEPVRRHVANIKNQYANQLGKPVYGLFIANRIDSNTAETFRIGIWYSRDDQKMQLDIVPMTLEHFKNFFETLFVSKNVDVNLIRELIDVCSQLRTAHEGPAWKQEIEQVINKKITQLKSSGVTSDYISNNLLKTIS